MTTANKTTDNPTLRNLRGETGPGLSPDQIAALLAGMVDAAEETEAPAEDETAVSAESIADCLENGEDVPDTYTVKGWTLYPEAVTARDAATIAATGATVYHNRSADDSLSPVGKKQAVWGILPHTVYSADGETSATVPGCYQKVGRWCIAVLSAYRVPGALAVYAVEKEDAHGVLRFWTDDGDARSVQRPRLNPDDSQKRPAKLYRRLGFAPALLVPASVRDAVSSVIGSCPDTYTAAVQAVARWVGAHAVEPGTETSPEAQTGCMGALGRLSTAVHGTKQERKDAAKVGKGVERTSRALARCAPSSVPEAIARSEARRHAAQTRAKGKGKGKAVKARSAL